MTDFQVFENFSLELCGTAAEIAVPIFRAGCGHDDKGHGGGFDPVTEADRGAEAAIRRLIGARFPDHGVVGEEYGEDRPDAEFVWILDPVDGTKSFVHEIEEVLAVRTPLYMGAAHDIIDVEKDSPAEIAPIILRLFEREADSR